MKHRIIRDAIQFSSPSNNKMTNGFQLTRILSLIQSGNYTHCSERNFHKISNTLRDNAHTLICTSAISLNRCKLETRIFATRCPVPTCKFFFVTKHPIRLKPRHWISRINGEKNKMNCFKPQNWRKNLKTYNWPAKGWVQTADLGHPDTSAACAAPNP